MLLLLIFFPLLGTIIGLTLSCYFGRRGSSFFIMILMLLSWFISLFFFFIILTTNQIILFENFLWFNVGRFCINWSVVLDSVTIIMLFIIYTISGVVHLYSLEYMIGDPGLPKFLSFLSFFTFFMVILVTGTNFLQLFLGWEGVGLCSYLLISFWTTRVVAGKAAMKALVINRLGDFGLIIAISGCYYIYGSLDYSIIFSLVPYFCDNFFLCSAFEINSLIFICFFLLIGAVGKSAQFGLHTWLPDAMEGPTPVSALIHAATMVTAGVFLIIKCSSLFEQAPIILLFICFISAVTIITASLIGLVQYDIKKVIAYSTCSQLGYMFLSCGISNYFSAFYHLLTHAFFKALLFLSAGSIIHATNDEQDIRKFGGLCDLLPFTYSVMLIGSYTIMGFPYLSAFYSKDSILESLFNNSSFFFWWGLLALCLTIMYTVKILYRVFLSEPNGFKLVYLTSQEPSYFITISLIILSFGSLFIGYCFQHFFLGNWFFGSSIYTVPSMFSFIDIEFIPIIVKMVSVFLILIIFSIVISIYLYYTRYILKIKFYLISFFRFFNKKGFFDLLQNKLLALPIFHFSFLVNSVYAFDKGLLEFFGPEQLRKKIGIFTKNVVQLHSGNIIAYLGIFLVSFGMVFHSVIIHYNVFVNFIAKLRVKQGFLIWSDDVAHIIIRNAAGKFEKFCRALQIPQSHAQEYIVALRKATEQEITVYKRLKKSNNDYHQFLDKFYLDSDLNITGSFYTVKDDLKFLIKIGNMNIDLSLGVVGYVWFEIIFLIFLFLFLRFFYRKICLKLN
jgi:proton-translocating NADH-quinone oxidoreductase chain L